MNTPSSEVERLAGIPSAELPLGGPLSARVDGAWEHTPVVRLGRRLLVLHHRTVAASPSALGLYRRCFLDPERTLLRIGRFTLDGAPLPLQREELSATVFDSQGNDGPGALRRADSPLAQVTHLHHALLSEPPAVANRPGVHPIGAGAFLRVEAPTGWLRLRRPRAWTLSVYRDGPEDGHTLESHWYLRLDGSGWSAHHTALPVG